MLEFSDAAGFWLWILRGRCQWERKSTLHNEIDQTRLLQRIKVTTAFLSGRNYPIYLRAAARFLSLGCSFGPRARYRCIQMRAHLFCGTKTFFLLHLFAAWVLVKSALIDCLRRCGLRSESVAAEFYDFWICSRVNVINLFLHHKYFEIIMLPQFSYEMFHQIVLAD